MFTTCVERVAAEGTKRSSCRWSRQLFFWGLPIFHVRPGAGHESSLISLQSFTADRSSEDIAFAFSFVCISACLIFGIWDTRVCVWICPLLGERISALRRHAFCNTNVYDTRWCSVCPID